MPPPDPLTEKERDRRLDGGGARAASARVSWRVCLGGAAVRQRTGRGRVQMVDITDVDAVATEEPDVDDDESSSVRAPARARGSSEFFGRS